MNGVRHAVSRHPHVPLETSCGFHHISSFLWEGEGVNARSANTGRGRAPVRGLVTQQPIRGSGLGLHSQSERGSPTLGCTLMQGPTTTTAREKLPCLPLTDQNSRFNADPSFLTRIEHHSYTVIAAKHVQVNNIMYHSICRMDIHTLILMITECLHIMNVLHIIMCLLHMNT